MFYKKCLILIILILSLLFFLSFQGIYSNYTKLLNIESIKQFKYIETYYKIEGKGKSSIETIKYFIDETLYVEEFCTGEYGEGYYTITTDRFFRPLTMETKWISEPEKADTFERYIYNYENSTILYINLKNSKIKTFSLNDVAADSVTLSELLVFSNNEKVKNLSTGGLIVPNAYQVPFIFRYIKDDKYKINNEVIYEIMYKAEINNPFLQFISSMFGNKAEIFLRSEFPHIRTRSFYSSRNVYLYDYKIIKK